MTRAQKAMRDLHKLAIKRLFVKNLFNGLLEVKDDGSIDLAGYEEAARDEFGITEEEKEEARMDHLMGDTPDPVNQVAETEEGITYA